MLDRRQRRATGLPRGRRADRCGRTSARAGDGARHWRATDADAAGDHERGQGADEDAMRSGHDAPDATSLRLVPDRIGASVHRTLPERNSAPFPALDSARILRVRVATVRARSEPSARLPSPAARSIPSQSVRSIRITCRGEGPRVYQDRALFCRDCSEEFLFSSGEQSFFASKGLQNDPQRCPSCRAAAKRARSSRMARASSMPRSAASAAARPSCRSPRGTTGRSTAARASTRSEPATAGAAPPDLGGFATRSRRSRPGGGRLLISSGLDWADRRGPPGPRARQP